MTYFVLKALHIIAAIVWTSGMLVAPAMVVWIASLEPEFRQRASLVCGRYYRWTTGPTLLLTLLFGVWMLSLGGWIEELWVQIKLGLILCLTGLHGFFGGQLRRLAKEPNYTPAAWIRFLIPMQMLTVASIVFLAVFKL